MKEKLRDLDFLPPEIEKIGRRHRVSRGETLFVEGESAESFFFVAAGEIRLYKMDSQGKEVEIVRLARGDFFGEAVAFVSGDFPAYAQAVADSEVLRFPRREVEEALGRYPSIARFFVKLLARKCVALNARIEALGLRTVRQRLIQFLLSRCSGGRECTVELKMQKGELARMLGTSGETLSRNLRQMQEEGLIEVRGRRITIKNCTALREEWTC